jgi:arginine:ornithine antiporter/lysine permease
MAASSQNRLSLFWRSAFVIGSMTGAGVFFWTRIVAIATEPSGAVGAWIVAAGGVCALARVFLSLAEGKPERNAGLIRRENAR